MRSKFHSVQKAFTLIELLIVIAIIGILMVAFLPTLRGGQAKARDASRKALISNMLVAIENRINEGGWTLPDHIPTTYCIDDWSTLPGSALATVLGRAPESYGSPENLCGGGGLLYKKFDVTNSYMLAIEMENASNANVEQALTVANLKALTAVAGVIQATDSAVGTGDSGKYYYAVAK